MQQADEELEFSKTSVSMLEQQIGILEPLADSLTVEHEAKAGQLHTALRVLEALQPLLPSPKSNMSPINSVDRQRLAQQLKDGTLDFPLLPRSLSPESSHR